MEFTTSALRLLLASITLTGAPFRREVNQLDKGASDVQSNMADVLGLLVRQGYGRCVSAPGSYTEYGK